MTEMEKLFEKMLNMELTNEEMFEQCRNVAHEPLTNEEWFCSLSTEEKAKVLCNVVPELAYENDGVWDEKKFVEWLKEKHE